jgi:hypothetical protein
MSLVTQDKCAALRRELEEKSVELVKEEKLKKKDVDEAMSSGREEMQRALDQAREEAETRIKNLEEQHAKKELALKAAFEEKMILFSSSTSSRAPTTCTVSEAQLKQSLAEAKEEMKVLKELNKLQVRLMQLYLAFSLLCALFSRSIYDSAMITIGLPEFCVYFLSFLSGTLKLFVC